MMEKGKKLKFPEGQEGVRGNQGFPLILNWKHKIQKYSVINIRDKSDINYLQINKTI
jgi:hypothetical protein